MNALGTIAEPQLVEIESLGQAGFEIEES